MTDGKQTTTEIGSLCGDIQILLASRGSDQSALHEQVSRLVLMLFDNDGFTSLADERLLYQIDQIFDEYEISAHYDKDLSRFKDHRRIIHDVHGKLSAVLNSEISIEELLLTVLDSWEAPTEDLPCSFDKSGQRRLETVRAADEVSWARLEQFFTDYLALLRQKGYADQAEKVEPLLRAAIADYREREQRGAVFSLFIEPVTHKGYVLGISIQWDLGCGQVRGVDDLGPELKKSAEVAFIRATQYLGIPESSWNVRWQIEQPYKYEGKSVGLALAVGMVSTFRNEQVDPYSAFTGALEFAKDRVEPVSEITKKMEVAKESGIRRVFVPLANADEARQHENDEFQVIPVGSLADAHSLLVSGPSFPVRFGTPSLQAKLREFKARCAAKGLTVLGSKVIQHGEQLEITDHKDRIPVNVYEGKKGTAYVVGGSPTSRLRKLIAQTAESVFGARDRKERWSKRTTVSFIIGAPEDSTRILERLRSLPFNCHEETQPGCDYRLYFPADGERVYVRKFTSGKLTVEGHPGAPCTDELCRCVEAMLGLKPGLRKDLQEVIASEAEKHANDIESIEARALRFETPWIGTDESGKGDYFGPLVTAGVYVDEEIAAQLKALGVKDSKRLSDTRVRQLAREIKDLCQGRYAIVAIPPETYNQLYESFRREGKRLNTLLAWAHARALEDILEKVDCRNVVADQFADEHYIRSRLLERSRGMDLNLVQMPRAEVNLGVAAASILARDRFLAWLGKASKRYGIQLPKGAASKVVKAAKEIVARFGKEELTKVAKVHFKTTKEVLN